MKKLIYLLSGCLCALALVACGNQKVTSDKNGIYQVKVTKTDTDKSDSWTIKDSTSAPDGTKIIAVGKDADSQSNAASNGLRYITVSLKPILIQTMPLLIQISKYQKGPKVESILICNRNTIMMYLILS